MRAAIPPAGVSTPLCRPTVTGAKAGWSAKELLLLNDFHQVAGYSEVGVSLWMSFRRSAAARQSAFAKSEIPYYSILHQYTTCS